jgi:predicted nucleotidyltransferase
MLALEKIVEVLDIQKDKILGIYQYGSRLHQCHSENSDFDLFIVYDVEKINKIEENEKYNISGHIMDPHTYKIYIENHDAVIILTLWMKNEQIIFETEEMLKFRKSVFIDIKRIERSFLDVERMCLLRSKRYFNNDKKKSLKNFVHGIRFLIFGNKIVNNGEIDDYTYGNEYFDEIMNFKFNSWEDCYQQVKPIFDKKRKEMKDSVLDEKLRFYGKYNEKLKDDDLLVIHFLKNEGLRNLKRIFSTKIDFLENGLIALKSDPILSNMIYVINKECFSTVIVDMV